MVAFCLSLLSSSRRRSRTVTADGGPAARALPEARGANLGFVLESSVVNPYSALSVRIRRARRRLRPAIGGAVARRISVRWPARHLAIRVTPSVCLLSLGIITGRCGQRSMGAYWQWDPKETAALLSWIVYAA